MSLLEQPTAPTIEELLRGPIDPEIETDIAKFEVMLARYRLGDLDEDIFRVFRLANGVYGQRQGGTAQMLRIKIPYGKITADQLDV